MRRYITLLLTIMLANAIYAQTATVSHFSANPIDLAAQRYKRTDIQGNICALIKVHTLAENVSAKGSVIGDVSKQQPGEYWVYMPGGAKMVKLFSDNFLPLMYNFPEPLQPGVTYTLVVDAPQPQSIPLTPFYRDRKYGYERDGHEVIAPQYDMARKFSEGVAAVELNGKWGFIDTTGRQVIPFEYRDAFDFSEGLACIENDDFLWGYIDKTGSVVIKPKYVEGWPLSGNRALVAVSTDEAHVYLYGFIDRNGNEVIPLDKYEGGYENFSEGLAVSMGDGGLYGYIDTDGNEVIPCRYDQANSFTEGMARVGNGDKYGYIDKSGQEAIPLKYDYADDAFQEGLARVQLDGKVGLIDIKGRTVIPAKYEEIGSNEEFSLGCDCFHEGLAPVKLNDKWGYVDKAGREVIPCQFEYAENFKHGKARVVSHDMVIVINRSGERVN